MGNAIAAVLPGGPVQRTPITPFPRCFNTGNAPATTTTPGNNSTPVVTEIYLAELIVPVRTIVGGIAVFNGTNVTGNTNVALYDANGNLIDTSILTGTAGSGTAGYQRIPFLGIADEIEPGTYYTAVQYSSGTARYCAHAVGNFGAGKLTGQVFGTFPANLQGLLPSTFTANLGNVAGLY